MVPVAFATPFLVPRMHANHDLQYHPVQVSNVVSKLTKYLPYAARRCHELGDTPAGLKRLQASAPDASAVALTEPRATCPRCTQGLVPVGIGDGSNLGHVLGGGSASTRYKYFPSSQACSLPASLQTAASTHLVFGHTLADGSIGRMTHHMATFLTARSSGVRPHRM